MALKTFLTVCSVLAFSLIYGQSSGIYKENLEIAKQIYEQGIIDKVDIEKTGQYDNDFIEKYKLAEFYAYSLQERTEEQMRKFVAIVKGDKSFLDKNKKDFSIVETEYAKIIMEIEVTLHEKLLNLKQ